jgi:hypothetical protein
MQIDELDLAVDHLKTARPAMARTMAKARSGAMEGAVLDQPQCREACDRCYLYCAGLVGIVARLEASVERLGGVTIAGRSYAFAGRA